MAVIIGIDQLTKAWAQQACSESLSVLPFLSCTLAYNRGVAWSLGSSDNTLMFHGVSALVVFLTAAMSVYAYHQHRKGCAVWAESALIAASVSNIYDRYTIGGVVDFIHFSYDSLSFPIFNCADVVIVLSVAYMILKEYREGS
jgi:signal peptidase II